MPRTKKPEKLHSRVFVSAFARNSIVLIVFAMSWRACMNVWGFVCVGLCVCLGACVFARAFVCVPVRVCKFVCEYVNILWELKWRFKRAEEWHVLTREVSLLFLPPPAFPQMDFFVSLRSD